ncbi:MAG: hypothetical protein WC132_04325 [Methanomethylophilus sp.]
MRRFTVIVFEKCEQWVYRLSFTEPAVISDSWTVYNETTTVKPTDKSVFLNFGSGIPIKTWFYFGIEDYSPGKWVGITVTLDGEDFPARLERINSSGEFGYQTRIIWTSRLSRKLNELYSGVVETGRFPHMSFTRLDYLHYRIELSYLS